MAALGLEARTCDDMLRLLIGFDRVAATPRNQDAGRKADWRSRHPPSYLRRRSYRMLRQASRRYPPPEPAALAENYCVFSKLRCIFSTSWSMLKLDGR